MTNKKRIAFITFGHWGSTIPLAKKLSEKGYAVDYYIETFGKVINSIEATDIHHVRTLGLLGKIDSNSIGCLKKYCKDVCFKYLRLVPPMVLHKYLGYISFLFNGLLIFVISLLFRMRKYDSIILVGRYTASHFIWYHRFLKSRIYTCMHEVCNHMNPDFRNPPHVLAYLFRKHHPIILHSDNCLNDIKKYLNCEDVNLHRINFGLFETWSYIPNDTTIQNTVGKDYILFIGGIDKYKGIDVLYRTIQLLRNKRRNYKLVIAGRGSVPELNEIKSLDNVLVIGKFLTNEEFANLIRYSRVVICPYTTMSQSGIPQSAYVMGKPVITSSLPGFDGIVIDKITGLICETGDHMSFADAIESIFTDKLLYESLCVNLKNVSEFIPSYDWDYISNQYIHLIENIDEKKSKAEVR